jgi:hypothetical protein
MSYLPDIYQHFERAFPNVHAAHQELAKACYQGGPLDARSARLVKLGVAIGAQAEGAVRSHARRALAENMTCACRKFRRLYGRRAREHAQVFSLGRLLASRSRRLRHSCVRRR